MVSEEDSRELGGDLSGKSISSVSVVSIHTGCEEIIDYMELRALNDLVFQENRVCGWWKVFFPSPPKSGFLSL